ncbi:restriction endonuclease subunit S, partial [Candidatus Avelusimicrobium fimicolum]|uniref:restriction endonuclease subunit S n=1 Tax=Candidatus Avelusimicrobium fimicolum TaxID=3416216 RepID=UPI003D12F71C
MTKLDQLIKGLCPNGVEYKTLEEVCTFQRGQTITAKDAVEGDVPVIAGGQKPAYYHNQSNRAGETITIAGSGAYAGYVGYWTIPIFLSDAFSVHPHKDKLTTKYVFYFLSNLQNKIYATKKG